MRHALSCLLLLTAFAGCTTAYQPQGANGGYTETQVGANVFRVTFKGNLRSTQVETNDMALLRAAELSVKNGYPFFVTGGFAPTGTAVSLATNTVSVPATTLTIQCFTTRPETSATVYEAESVMATLGARYYVRP